jgi:hypothetical protein
MNKLILYTPEDGRRQIKLRAEQQTVRPTQLEMAELSSDLVVKNSLTVQEMFVWPR